MKLETFIQALHRAEGGVHVEDILDAFWLATRGKTLTLHGKRVPTSTMEAPEPSRREKQKRTTALPPKEETPKATTPPEESHAVEKSQAPIFARGETKSEDVTVRASPVVVPAGYALTNRLKLSRALRPFLRRFPSPSRKELDEEKTVIATAEHLGRLQLVFRGSQEPWFDAEMVMEDDPALGAWRDPLSDFAQVLRETGAFRQVRSWRLRLAPAGASPGSGQSGDAILESASEVRIRPETLCGRGVRRLIFFANHGASDHWLNGRYARLLDMWGRTACVASLYLTPRTQWVRGALGEPPALCHALEPGAATCALAVQRFWWSLAEPREGMTRVPAIPLTPEGLAEFALMQMGRGRHCSVYLLDRHPPERTTRNAEPVKIEQSLALLGEASPEAYRLAVYLCSKAFTIPVARLVQEATMGGAVEPDYLGQIMLSGLVVAHTPPRAAADPVELYYQFHEDARKILLRSLRETDAQLIAGVLEKRVSEYIEKITGRTISFRGLVPNEMGHYELPAWAQPFAIMGRSLLGESTPSPEASATLLMERFRGAQNARVVGDAAWAAARYASEVVMDPTTIEPVVWSAMVDGGLVKQGWNGRWSFAPGVEAMLRGLVEHEPLKGVILYLLLPWDAPTVWTDLRRRLESLGAECFPLHTKRLLARKFPLDGILLTGAINSRSVLQISKFISQKQQLPVPIIMLDGSATSLTKRLQVYKMGFVGCASSNREVIELIREAAGRLNQSRERAQRTSDVWTVMGSIGLTLPTNNTVFWLSAAAFATDILATNGGAEDQLVFEKFVEIIRAYTDARNLQLYKQERVSLRVVAAAGPPGTPSPMGVVAAPSGMVSRAAREKGIVWAPDVSEEEEYVRYDSATQSELVISLLDPDDELDQPIVGMVNVEMERLDGLSVGEIRWLERFCAPLAHRLKVHPESAQSDRKRMMRIHLTQQTANFGAQMRRAFTSGSHGERYLPHKRTAFNALIADFEMNNLSRPLPAIIGEAPHFTVEHLTLAGDSETHKSLEKIGVNLRESMPKLSEEHQMFLQTVVEKIIEHYRVSVPWTHTRRIVKEHIVKGVFRKSTDHVAFDAPINLWRKFGRLGNRSENAILEAMEKHIRRVCGDDSQHLHTLIESMATENVATVESAGDMELRFVVLDVGAEIKATLRATIPGDFEPFLVGLLNEKTPKSRPK